SRTASIHARILPAFFVLRRIAPRPVVENGHRPFFAIPISLRNPVRVAVTIRDIAIPPSGYPLARPLAVRSTRPVGHVFAGQSLFCRAAPQPRLSASGRYPLPWGRLRRPPGRRPGGPPQ